MSEIDVVEMEDRHVPGFLGLLSRWVRPEIVRHRYEWMYLRNPCGKTTVFLAFDKGGDAPVGCNAYIPKWMNIAGKKRKCILLSDLFIDPAARGKGVATEINRVALQALRERGEKIFYGFPLDRSAEVFRRMGCVELGRMRELAIPLSVRVKMSALPGFARPIVSGCADALLAARIRWILKGSGRERDVVHLEGPDGRQDEVWERQAESTGITSWRDRSYVQWRFLDNPVKQYRLLAYVPGSRFLGYAVYEIVDGHFLVRDFAFGGSQEQARAFLGRIVVLAMRHKCLSVRMLLRDQCRSAGLFAGAGFLLRELHTAYFVILDPTLPAAERTLLTNPANWFLTYGDTDLN